MSLSFLKRKLVECSDIIVRLAKILEEVSKYKVKII